MSVRVEQVAAEALRSWLLLKLPAKVAEVNATRAATLVSPWAGPYAIPTAAVGPPVVAAAVLPIGSAVGTYTGVPLTGGAARSATQVAADIGALASVDTEDRLVLTAAAAPTQGAASVMALGPDTTGANSALGFHDGGERCVRSALVAPRSRDVLDGWPVSPDFGRCMSVVIGDRASSPLMPPHRHEQQVTLEVAVLWQEPNVVQHRSREAISACVRCVREVLQSDKGRTLGQPKLIILCIEQSCTIAGVPCSFSRPGAPSPLFDVAVMTLSLKVYEVPTP